MTSMQPHASENGTNTQDLFGINLLDMDSPTDGSHTPSFPSQLKTAREARDQDIEACASALRLPARVLRQLEAGTYEGIDSKVYLASYIGKYSRYLGLDESLIQQELDRIRQVEPTLVATGGISHSRFLFDRYATAATYVVLTAVLVVPMVWLGVRGTLDRDLSHLAPLDAAPVAQQEVAPVPSGSTQANLTSKVALTPPNSAVQVPPVQAEEQTLMASMAPFPSLDNTLPTTTAKVDAAAIDTGTGSHSLSLDLTAASWVEVIASDGTRLEYGLLTAGTHKVYHSDQPLDVRVGNAAAAQVSIDGKALGLDDFRRANVARFRVQIQDGGASATSL